MNDTGRRVELSVLNANGMQGTARQMTIRLRSRGYDVVEIGNYEKGSVDSSFVILWNSDTTTARKVARAAGIRQTKVVQRKNPKALVDCSVVLGNDCRQLIPPPGRGGNHQ